MRDPLSEVQFRFRRAWACWAALGVALLLLGLTRPTAFFTVVVIFAFFVMIMLHELGHLVMAKRTGAPLPWLPREAATTTSRVAFRTTRSQSWPLTC